MDTMGGLCVGGERMRDQPLCSYCRHRPVDPRWRPFCSERCKLADLGRWLSGDYRMPGPVESPDDEEDAE